MKKTGIPAIKRKEKKILIVLAICLPQDSEKIKKK